MYFNYFISDRLRKKSQKTQNLSLQEFNVEELNENEIDAQPKRSNSVYENHISIKNAAQETHVSMEESNSER